MKRLLQFAAAVGLPLVTVAVSWAGLNLNSSKSNIYREFPGTRLVSASTPLTGPNQTQTVYTTPPTGDFILTQFCTSPVNGGVRLNADGLGGIAQTGTTLCYTFQPGFILPPGAAINCATTLFADAGSYFCTIAGVLRE